MHFRARGILSVQLYWPELSGKFSQNFSKIFPEIFFRRAGQFRKGGGSLPPPLRLFFRRGVSPLHRVLPANGTILRHITSTRQETTSSLMNTTRQEIEYEQIPFLYRLWTHPVQDGPGTPGNASEGIVMPGPVQPDGREMDPDGWYKSAPVSTEWELHETPEAGRWAQAPVKRGPGSVSTGHFSFSDRKNDRDWKILIAIDRFN
jgi:hypothetical protein